MLARSSSGALVATIAVVLFAFSSTITPARAATALILGGAKPYNVLSEEQMAAALNGYFADYDRINIAYPGEWRPFTGLFDRTLEESVQIGVDKLYEAIFTTSGPKTVVGVSQGGLVLDETLRRLADDPAAPSKDELTFVIVADPRRGNGVSVQGPPPVTKYDLVVVVGEYDGWADFPDRRWNLIAVANALMGMRQVHTPSFFNSDLSTVPAENITTTINTSGGVTITYLVPTEHLPLLALPRRIGVPEPLVAAVECILKPVVDLGYSRNDGVRVQPAIDTAIEHITAADRPGAARASPADPRLAREDGATDLTDGNKVTPRTHGATRERPVRAFLNAVRGTLRSSVRNADRDPGTSATADTEALGATGSTGGSTGGVGGSDSTLDTPDSGVA